MPSAGADFLITDRKDWFAELSVDDRPGATTISMLSQILLAEKDRAVRKNMRRILLSVDNWTICAEVESPGEAIQFAEKQSPGVAILDFESEEAFETTRQIHGLSAKTRVLLVCHDDQPEVYLPKSVRAGARGCVLFNDIDTELVPAVETIQRGKVYIPPPLRSVRGWAEAQAHRSSTADPLSAREIQVLRLVAQGYSSKQTAETLSISVKTVEAHRARIMRKLGMHSIVELVHYAIREKIVKA
jgi:two-component system, NarL family, response regulator NreC